MEKYLVENTHGHNGVLKNPLYHRVKHKVKRLFRPTIGKSSVPYDWNNPTPAPVVKIKNQYQAYSCGGEAGSYGASIQLGTAELSAKSGYSLGFAQGGGMRMSVLENVLTSRGLTLETTVPSYKPDGTTDELFMEDTSWVNPNTNSDALLNKLGAPINVAIDVESIAEACRDYKFVIFLLQGQNGNNWLGYVPTPPIHNNGTELWGHYMCGTRGIIYNGVKGIESLQSWGDQVGQSGRQFISQDYIDSGFIVDVFAFQPKPVPLPPNIQAVVDKSTSPSWTARFLAFLRLYGIIK